MADTYLPIRIRDLPEDNSPSTSDWLATDGNGGTRRARVADVANAGIPVATTPQATAGVDDFARMTSLKTRQAIEFYGPSLFATVAQGAKADTAVQPARSITAGAGLTGGGDLSANRTIALSAASQAAIAAAQTAVQPTVQIIAGTGLTGGGNLSANRTLSFDEAYGDARYQRRSERGQPSGYPTLDGSGKVPTAQLPDFAPLSHVGAGGTAHALVTTSVAGFMSAADKVKLDNLIANGPASVDGGTY